MYKSRNKIISKFVEKLLNDGIRFKEIFTFLGLDYRDALLINCILLSSHKKIKNQHVWNGPMDILVTIIELLCFLNCTKLQQESQFKVWNR